MVKEYLITVVGGTCSSNIYLICIVDDREYGVLVYLPCLFIKVAKGLYKTTLIHLRPLASSNLFVEY